jgi:hypothetical protein
MAQLDPEFKPLVDFVSGSVIYSIHPDTLRPPQAPDPHQPMRRRGENWASVLRTLQSSGARNDFRAAMALISMTSGSPRSAGILRPNSGTAR